MSKPQEWARFAESLNPNVVGLQPSPTVTSNELADALRREGRSVAKLGLGVSPFPVPRPVVEALRLHAAEKEYLPVRGLAALKDAVADYHHRAIGLDASGADVLIGPGSKELMFLLQVVFDGDLLVASPSWVSYVPQARIVRKKPISLETSAADGWRLPPAQLDRYCRETGERPRVMILNYPSNPTGTSYSAAELGELADVARKHRIIVLSDEIYGELHYQGGHTSISRWYPEGTIVSSGLSKWCGAGGWRLGTFTFPHSMHWLLEAMAAVASETYTSTSAPIQYAAITAFRGGTEIERYLRNARRVLHALSIELVGRLREAGIAVVDPVGAFYLFPDFSPLRARLAARGIHTSAQLAERLLADTGVALLPGEPFGRPPEELSARIAFVDFDGARALTAVEVLEARTPLDRTFVETYCGNLLRAVDRIAEWATT